MAWFSFLLFLNCAELCLTLCNPWIVAHQDPLSLELSRQEYWSGLPFPTPKDLPDPRIKPASPALAGDSWLLSHQGSPDTINSIFFISSSINIQLRFFYILCLLWTVLQWTWQFMYPFEILVSILLNIELEAKWADNRRIFILNILTNWNIVSHTVYNIVHSFFFFFIYFY